MSRQNALAKLLRVSLARNTNKKLFVSLLEQLLAREPVPDAQLGESLLDLTEDGTRTSDGAEKNTKRLRIEYSVEFALSSPENVARFFRILPQLSHFCQHKYVEYYKGQIEKTTSRPIVDDFYEALRQYTVTLNNEISSQKPTPVLKRLWYSLVFLWGGLVDHDSSLSSNTNLKEGFLGMVQAASTFGDPHIGDFVARKLWASDSTVLSQLQEQNVVKIEQSMHPTKSAKPLNLNLTGKKYASYVALKKFIWLNSHFQQWRANIGLTHAFSSFFDLHESSHAELAKELITSFLNGFATAARSKEKPYVVFNWKNFIVTQLVSDLQKLHNARSDEWDEAITSAVLSCDSSITHTNVGGAQIPYDLGKEFLRGCLYQGIVSLEKFLKTYPAESENLSAPLLTHEIEKLASTESMALDFKAKLENVSPEFTSLEESKAMEYFRNLPATNFRFSRARQQKLASLMDDLVVKLIQEKNNEKLSWVALVFSNVPTIANYVFYQSQNGPWMFLQKVINYIDGESFPVDEDDGNFQDTYASFGVILTGAISVASLLGVDFSAITIKNSYTVDFINGFFYRSCDTLTNSYTGDIEQEREIISNYDNLFTEWANALFDVNNDGLSDDLLKSVNVKQIYKFIVILFRQAFTARTVGSLSENSLNNGIDYLSQNFLAPCSLEAMQWIASKMGPQQKNNDIMVEILMRIIEGNVGDAMSDSNGQKFTCRMILNIIGPDLMKKLNRTFSAKVGSDNIEKIRKIIIRETDAEYCQWQKSGPPAKYPGNSSDSVKNEVVRFSKETSATTETISETWSKIRHRWKIVPVSEAWHTVLQEVEHSSSARSVASDESRLVVDFFVFMMISAGCPDQEDVSAYITEFSSARPLEVSSEEQQKQFTLTINDHYSSIFNEDVAETGSGTTPKEERPRSREELMGDFEMGDLFDDMSENFFDESMTSFSKPASALATETGPFLDVASIYKELRRSISPLSAVSQLGVSPQYEHLRRLAGLARGRIEDELQRWKAAHG